MIPLFIRLRLLLPTLIAGLAVGASALAMEIGQPLLQETWTLNAGSVFEIVSSPSRQDHQYLWSLTKADGTFVQADRGPLFRERFMEPGAYLLKGEVTDAQNRAVADRTFAINVTSSAQTGTGTTPTYGLVQTDPLAAEDGWIRVRPEHQTLLFIASPEATGLSLDLDGAADANADGDPANDDDSRGTFFASDGSPLRVWFTSGLSNRMITVRGMLAGQPQTMLLRLSSDDAPALPITETGSLPSPLGLEMIEIADLGSGSYAFSVNIQTLAVVGKPLLFLWDFGDGRQSMLDRPTHTFAENGQYAVSLRARDLNTTQEILSVTGILPVQTIAPPFAPASSSSAPTESSASSVTSSANPGQSILSRIPVRWIAVILGALLLAVLAGFILVTFISRVLRSHGQSAPAAVTPGISKKQGGLPSLDQEAPPLSVVTDVASPMTVIDVPTGKPDRPKAPSGAPPTSEPSPPPKAPQQEDNATDLVFREEQAPSWLRHGHEEAKKRGQTPLNPPPAPLREPSADSVITASPVEPAQTPQEQPEKDKRPLPPWLQESAAPPVLAPPPALSTPLPPADVTPKEAPVTAALETVPPALPPPPVPEPKEIPVPAAQAVPTAPESTQDTQQEKPKELTEAERERRRKKRARYRENVRKREEEKGTVNPMQEPPAPAPAQPTKPGPTQPSPASAAPAPVRQKEAAPVPKEETVPPSQKTEEGDAPIAIIRADDLSQGQGKEKKK